MLGSPRPSPLSRKRVLLCTRRRRPVLSRRGRGIGHTGGEGMAGTPATPASESSTLQGSTLQGSRIWGQDDEDEDAPSPGVLPVLRRAHAIRAASRHGSRGPDAVETPQRGRPGVPTCAPSSQLTQWFTLSPLQHASAGSR